MTICGPFGTAVRCALYNLIAVGLVFNIGLRAPFGSVLDRLAVGCVGHVVMFPSVQILESGVHLPDWAVLVLPFVANPLLWGIAGGVLHRCLMNRGHRAKHSG